MGNLSKLLEAADSLIVFCFSASLSVRPGDFPRRVASFISLEFQLH